ncbi:hypothetical protein MASR1M107_10160 [Ignavibacteriales bacterium]
MIEIDKAYSSAPVELKWYKYWQDHKLFKSEVDSKKTPYTIVIPPKYYRDVASRACT